MARDSDRSLEADAWRSLQVVGVLALLFLILLRFASERQLVASFGVLLLAQFGLTLLFLQRKSQDNQLPRSLQTLLVIAKDPEVLMAHDKIARALAELIVHRDPVFRRAALQRLGEIVDECVLLGDSTIEFNSTESWRVVYDELLRSPGINLYRSVSWVQSPGYWQDSVGQQSTKLNLDLHDAGVVSVERIAIISDHLWPEDALFPIDMVHQWLDTQHRYGIWLQLLRESDLADEPDLVSDFGIYGNRAVGHQYADSSGRTQRFVLSFDFDKLKRAEEQWKRLAVFSVPYRDLLDRAH